MIGTIDNAALLRRGQHLEYLTLAWNFIGVIVVFHAAFVAGSIALTGFGLDSLIEIGASMVVVWQLTGAGAQREKLALRLIGMAFIAIALYILVAATRTLILHVKPETSLLGIAWLVCTVIAMVALAQGKRITGTLLDNPVLVTESRVTMVDALLAAAILLGLGLHALLGWWWADPVASLVIVIYGVKESRHAWAESAAYGFP